MEKDYISISVLSKYEVVVKTIGTVFKDDSRYEDYSSEELRTISGYDLLAQFSSNLEDCDIFDFSVKNNTYHFSYFTPSNGSY